MDNATVFDVGLPLVAPDLAAFLIVQMDVLSELAARLDDPDASDRWSRQADDMLARLIGGLWDGQRFHARRLPDALETDDSESVVPFLPMILGQRLPLEIRRRLVVALRDSGLITPHGVATEAPAGPLYQADGYWRGPIWAPITALVVDGLAACGEAELADELARRFVEMCRRSGFAENFEATTGRPLRDTGYTWTAETFFVMADRSRRGEDPFAARGRERSQTGGPS
jgi:glycogen debranching enzyme